MKTTTTTPPILSNVSTFFLLTMMTLSVWQNHPSIVADAFANAPTLFSARTSVSSSSWMFLQSPKQQHHHKIGGNAKTSPRLRSTTPTASSSSELLGSTVDPEDVLPLASSSITPEGYGFSSPVSRILKLTTNGNFYRAMATDSVTEVMDSITAGVTTDAALVFSDDNQLVGIFTETDYIKVRVSLNYEILFQWSQTQNTWYRLNVLTPTLCPFDHFVHSSRWNEPKLLRQKRSLRPTWYKLKWRTTLHPQTKFWHYPNRTRPTLPLQP
jgi:hypothetical protein